MASKIRAAMFGGGLLTAFTAACLSDAEVLLGISNGNAIAALLFAAAALIAPAVSHIINRGTI